MLIHFIVFISKDVFPSQVPHMKQKRSRSLITKINQIFYQKGNFIQKQLYWYRTSAWVFSCKFAVYFQNTSS